MKSFTSGVIAVVLVALCCFGVRGMWAHQARKEAFDKEWVGKSVKFKFGGRGYVRQVLHHFDQVEVRYQSTGGYEVDRSYFIWELERE
jgi:hypothetical protein